MTLASFAAHVGFGILSALCLMRLPWPIALAAIPALVLDAIALQAMLADRFADTPRTQGDAS